MTITLIIFGIFILAAFYSGFYFGHMKREGKPPESMPIIDELRNMGKELKKLKDKPIELKSFYD